MLKTFTGFRGVACLAEVGGVPFVLIAATPKKLATVYQTLLPHAPEFDPAMCQKSVMIQSAVLPDTKNEPKSNQA